MAPFQKLQPHELTFADQIIGALAESVCGRDESPLGHALVLHRLKEVSRKLDEVLENQREQEIKMSNAQQTIDRVVTDVNAMKADIAATLTTAQQAVDLIAGIPQKVADAVAAAIAANPGVDLSALENLTPDLEASDAALKGAQTALQAAIDATATPTPTPVAPLAPGEAAAVTEPAPAGVTQVQPVDVPPGDPSPVG